MTFEELTNERLTRLMERVYFLECASAKDKAEPSQTETELVEWLLNLCGKTGDHAPMRLWRKFLKEIGR